MKLANCRVVELADTLPYLGSDDLGGVWVFNGIHPYPPCHLGGSNPPLTAKANIVNFV